MALLLLALAVLATATTINIQSPMKTAQAACHWHGLQGLRHMVAFGDSFTSTGFEFRGPQPTQDNPLGNPPYPGRTFANGPNWIDYLTVQYNQSLITTLNFAVGGATVDPVIPRDIPNVKEQVFDQFLPFYGSSPHFFPWMGHDTLFAFFIGINDIASTFPRDTGPLFRYIFKTYTASADAIYRAGGRNFLFLNVPPIHRTPWNLAKYGETGQHRGKYVATIYHWNQLLIKLVNQFRAVHSDVTATLFNTYNFYDNLLDDPNRNPLTAPYKDTKNWCPAYALLGYNSPTDSYVKDESCEYAADEYFWLNCCHPTFRMHEATAEAIAQQLGRLHGCSSQ
ncbi:carbohydrate esterase family 16 protein [Myriangium duriaei CBS 260.36]|uniref:Carbohydrate esterase family 16 protein n=1 Tax=Myriangium duriaei CBS 260.36 TaxID=1168546 RepID=A0A9P4IXV8_9PEZI|nr:carbohydrate esterase family 16 protein [Myriangium duriaei CBS 260.36]